jgi:hypothetical protein
MTLAMIPGINHIKMRPYHYCIQTGRLLPMGPVDFLYQMDIFLTALGFENVGRTPDDVVKYAERVEHDANKGVLEDFVSNELRSVYNDPFGSHGNTSENFNKSLEGLKKDLEIAVRKEDYEKAATLRDHIEQLESKNKS